MRGVLPVPDGVRRGAADDLVRRARCSGRRCDTCTPSEEEPGDAVVDDGQGPKCRRRRKRSERGCKEQRRRRRRRRGPPPLPRPPPGVEHQEAPRTATRVGARTVGQRRIRIRLLGRLRRRGGASDADALARQLAAPSPSAAEKKPSEDACDGQGRDPTGMCPQRCSAIKVHMDLLRPPAEEPRSRRTRPETTRSRLQRTPEPLGVGWRKLSGDCNPPSPAGQYRGDEPTAFTNDGFSRRSHRASSPPGASGSARFHPRSPVPRGLLHRAPDRLIAMPYLAKSGTESISSKFCSSRFFSSEAVS